ncbi:hypothetical protein CR513_45716, partial [Mucuna pruriens]
MLIGLIHPVISNPLLGINKKQNLVARSNAKVQYRAMTLFLKELQFEETMKMTLICDNQVALDISSNPLFHERIEHIELSTLVTNRHVSSLNPFETLELAICNKLGSYGLYALAV